MSNIYFKSTILLENLLERIKPASDEKNFILVGEITNSEYEALQLAIKSITLSQDYNNLSFTENSKLSTLEYSNQCDEALNANLKPELAIENLSKKSLDVEQKEFSLAILAREETSNFNKTVTKQSVDINFNSLKINIVDENVRVCLDFGTAMSKATLIDNSDENEEIEVLKLGKYTDQEEINEYMMMSSIFISQEGLVFFGKKAWDYSMAVGGTNHQRIDNIKMYLLEDFEEKFVDKIHNPTEIKIKYETLLIGILGFLCEAVNKSLDDLGYSKYVMRRFAYPCPSNELSDTYKNNLKKLLLHAQILADTYNDKILDGIEINELVSVTNKIKLSCQNVNPKFITEGLTEPVGVAGSLISWKQPANTLALIVDIGAGTTDITMYRLKYDPETQKSIAREIAETSRKIDMAGDYLDQLLIALILSSKNISFDSPKYSRYVNELKLDIRNTKELLFNNGSISNIFNDGEVYEISLHDFLNFKGVKNFTETIKDTIADIIYNLDVTTVKTAPNNAIGVSFTGGGAELPMINDILNHKYISFNYPIDLRITRIEKFPIWMQNNYSELEEIYPRIAVSLGGARKRILTEGSIIKKSNF